MNAQHSGQPPARTTMLAWISAGVVVFLLLISFSVVTSDSLFISDQIALIIERSADPSIKTSCALIQDTLQRLTFVTTVLAVSILAALIACVAMLKRKGRIERKLHADLESVLADAQRANQSKSTFLGNVAHDIRTPLNAVTGFTSIARQHLDDQDRVGECLDHITIASKNLLDLINDVLDMGAIESGKLMLNEERFSLPQFIYNFILTEEPQMRLNGLSLTINIGDISQTKLIGDSRRLRKILSNLTSNAVKYTPAPGEITFSLTEERHDEDGYNNYWFSVEDNGIGMNPDFIERIFEPFVRESTASMQAAEGTGLGMSIIKSTLDLIGGRIEIESEPDVGSRFTVIVPLRIPAVNAEPCTIAGFDQIRQHCTDVRKNARPYATGTSFSGHVLLVEDDELNQLVASELISSFGAQVDIAEDGLAAAEIFENAGEGAFDIVFMDWRMPRADGLEATSLIRKIEEGRGWSRTPIIAMTANAFDEDRKRALAGGMDGFIAKPISLETIEHFLKKHLPEKPSSN